MARSHTAIAKELQSQLLQEVFLPLTQSHKDLSLQMSVLFKTQKWNFIFGKDYEFFDLASLTKPIFTMSLCMHLEDRYPGFVSEAVSRYLPWFAFPQVKIKDLLAHQSGAPALYPVFEELQHNTLGGLEPLNLLMREVDFNMTEPTYSDVGFFILGAVLEEAFNRPLIEIFQDAKRGALSSALTGAWGEMHFRLTGEKQNSKAYAPTENCPLRHKVIQSEVHDESCWKMGGVSTHAGFFGSLHDVTHWVEVLNQVFQKNKFYSSKTITSFYKKQKGDWRLGLMVPSRPRSTSGESFSEASYGHLGFTGTSIWVDPKQELSVVVLSNRTYPDRRINMLNQFRPHIHNLVATVIKDNK